MCVGVCFAQENLPNGYEGIMLGMTVDDEAAFLAPFFAALSRYGSAYPVF